MQRPLSLAVAVCLAGVGLSAQRPADTGPRADPATRASDALAADLYAVLRKQPGNLFFSPYSVHVALAMTREGARGRTAEEMTRVLHLGDLDAAAAAAHAALREAMAPRMIRDYSSSSRERVPSFRLEVANRVWGQEGLTFLAPFTGVLAEQYDAPIASIDFTDTAAARKRINDWVAERTKDRVRDIVPEDLPTPDTLMALANAIWFKAQWQTPFEERATKPRPFTTAAGPTAEVPMMHHTGVFRYAETEHVQVCELPYRGGDVAMLVVLPRRVDGLATLDVGQSQLARWAGATKQRRVAVAVPKFEFTCAYRLEQALQELGMKTPFTARADFTGMTRDEPLMIGPVLHKAFVAIDEKGTEAAAATVVLMKRGGRPPSSEPIAFTADRPFLFAIRHRKTGCTLFLGHVADPRSGGGA